MRSDEIVKHDWQHHATYRASSGDDPNREYDSVFEPVCNDRLSYIGSLVHILLGDRFMAYQGA